MLQKSISRCQVVPLTHSFSVVSDNITINYTLPKTRLGLFRLGISVSDFDNGDVGLIGPGPKADFCEMTQSNGHDAAQTHLCHRFRHECKARMRVPILCEQFASHFAPFLRYG